MQGKSLEDKETLKTVTSPSVTQYNIEYKQQSIRRGKDTNIGGHPGWTQPRNVRHGERALVRASI